MNKNFARRHIGTTKEEQQSMLESIGFESIDALIDKTIPKDIRTEPLNLPPALGEREYLEHISELAKHNIPFRSYIGQGWYDVHTPSAILRNVFENPVWYTSYTPYQAEISQGRLEALFNFQTMICELTAMPLANCSLLDESTAAAEAITMLYNIRPKSKKDAHKVFVDRNVFAQTLAVIKTRAKGQGYEIIDKDWTTWEPTDDYFAALVQFPNSNGLIEDYKDWTTKLGRLDIKVAVACDILSLTLLTPPGEWGAEVCVGSTQRLGIPMYFGGPSAAFFATKEANKRFIPGRIIGLSKDHYGKPALRMALQTREQHIKRDKATSNICTAQALLATMSSFYGVFLGPKGLKHSASCIHYWTKVLDKSLRAMGYTVLTDNFFDTIAIRIEDEKLRSLIKKHSEEQYINFFYKNDCVIISVNETSNQCEISTIVEVFASAMQLTGGEVHLEVDSKIGFMERESTFMKQEVFNLYHTETELMRYIKRLDRKDISLAHSMIPLGSCTMKLNAAAELLPLNDDRWHKMHPFAPKEQAKGYYEMIDKLGKYLAEITGMNGVSFQPNSGAAGEYAGLRTIRSYHEANGNSHRDIVLIPSSAHGTNPASSAQCGCKVVVVNSDEQGNIDEADFVAKLELHKDNVAALMVTYPSTHGIFELEVKRYCKMIHDNGGLVYMDGANMNAQVGLTNPGFIGADVCHLNLHKTFAIPHGGGGPGQGPICVKEHLVPYIPQHFATDGSSLNTVSSAPFGSAAILEITYGYITMMGSEGLTRATQSAILNANYIAGKLKDSYGIVYKGAMGCVGHELILECRNIKKRTGLDESDIAKRLMDYGYHAPTLSFPVHGTLMIEPTESESLVEIDRFCDVMLKIYEEITEVEKGEYTLEDNVLRNAPHPQYEVCDDEWKHSYPRKKAAFPLPYLEENKFWINVARIDNAGGDRNLVARICVCEA